MTSTRYRALKRRKAFWLKLFRFSAFVLAAIGVTGIAFKIIESLSAPYSVFIPGLDRWLDEPAFLKAAFYTIAVFWVASPLLAGFLFRNRALRILLLRPFGATRMTTALRRLVPKHLGPEGYVFTLSDRNYRPRQSIGALLLVPVRTFHILVTYLFGPILRNSIRICSVCNERRFRKLQSILLRKFRPSCWSFLTAGQAFNFQSTGDWCQSCMQLLMQSCDVIVVDLSKVKAGTAWELDELRLCDLQDKCLFVTGEEYLADAGQVLDAHFGDVELPSVHLYGHKGQLV